MNKYILISVLLVFCLSCSCSSKKMPDKIEVNADTLPLKKSEALEVDTSKVYVTVEQMPVFPGGETEMSKYVSQNLNYPIIPEDKIVENIRTAVRFIVSRTGEIKDIKVTKPQYEGTILTDSLTQLIKRMPKWIPGKQNGVNVNVYFTLPLHVSPRR